MRIAERRERWGLTWFGRLLVLVVAAVAVVGIGLAAYPFLAITEQAGADILVVEGWIPERTYLQVAELFQTGAYGRIVVVVPVYPGDVLVDAHGVYLDDRLRQLVTSANVPESSVDVILSPTANRDRTYHAAMVVRQWLEEQGRGDSTIVVATLGPHARRSRLLYREAFGPDLVRGVIALRDHTYDPQHWWRSNEGLRTVLSEIVAYAYAKVFFRPPPPPKEGYQRFSIPNRVNRRRRSASIRATPRPPGRDSTVGPSRCRASIGRDSAPPPARASRGSCPSRRSARRRGRSGHPSL